MSAPANTKQPELALAAPTEISDLAAQPRKSARSAPANAHARVPHVTFIDTGGSGRFG